mmetsp:Transcript_16284/g.33025  ORF Transcript_16284/g.33025 Transcript_16284/m.33025 type:complete len:232 (-) Transcript_16284:486-1181(-)
MPIQREKSSVAHGHWVFSQTFEKISQPLTNCHANSAVAPKFSAMCAVRAQSFPFCIWGTRDALRAQRTGMAAPAKRCGPGNSFPALAYVFSGPSTAKKTPAARTMDAAFQCLSLKFSEMSALRRFDAALTCWMMGFAFSMSSINFCSFEISPSNAALSDPSCSCFSLSSLMSAFNFVIGMEMGSSTFFPLTVGICLESSFTSSPSPLTFRQLHPVKAAYKEIPNRVIIPIG